MSPSITAKAQKTSAVKPRRTMRPRDDGGTIRCVVHLPGRRRIFTGSGDGSIRLWNLDSGAQIGDDWRDAGDEAHVYTMALSPDKKTIAAGTSDGTVRLWDIEMRRVIAKSTEHTLIVSSVCWSADGEHVVSGSFDGTARVWDVWSGKIVLNQLIKTGHEHIYTVNYSPDITTIATGGSNNVEIWDSKTGELLTTIKHNDIVFSLAWTSDQKRLIFGSNDGLIRVFDTTAWKEIAILKGHQNTVYNISLSSNDCLLASASWDQTARLWNLDNNLAVGPPLQHEDGVNAAAISADGRLLVTGCEDDNTQVWDVHTILKDAGVEGLLSIPDKIAARKPFIDTDATTRRPAQLENAHQLPRGFFDDARDGVHVCPSATRGTHSRLSTLRRRATARSSTLRPYAFLGRISSIVRRSQPNTEESTELQQQPRQMTPSHHDPPVTEVAAIRDKQALYVAPRPERISDKVKRIRNPTWWTRCILFICCAPIPDTNDSPQRRS